MISLHCDVKVTSQDSGILYSSVFVVFTAVCVAGYNLSKSEILELHLPLRLFAQEKKVKKPKMFKMWC